MQIMKQQPEMEAEWLSHKQGTYVSSQHDSIKVRYRDTPPESDPSKTPSGPTRDDHGALNPENRFGRKNVLWSSVQPACFPDQTS
jgi:hypothetical protein